MQIHHKQRNILLSRRLRGRSVDKFQLTWRPVRWEDNDKHKTDLLFRNPSGTLAVTGTDGLVWHTQNPQCMLTLLMQPGVMHTEGGAPDTSFTPENMWILNLITNFAFRSHLFSVKVVTWHHCFQCCYLWTNVVRWWIRQTSEFTEEILLGLKDIG